MLCDSSPLGDKGAAQAEPNIPPTTSFRSIVHILNEKILCRPLLYGIEGQRRQKHTKVTSNYSNNEESMFYGASPTIFKMARELRDNLTEAEKALWEKLNQKQLGVKFRRQHPINIYIADFYCHEVKLVIEVDGDYHLNTDQNALDELRSEDMATFGIEVVRFKNEEVLNETAIVVEEIKKAIARRTPNP